MWYEVLGLINTLFIFVSLFGVYSQLRKIQQRRRDVAVQSATKVLSQNQFMMSFCAYFSFFVYGYSIEPFNHYIVWPRFVASFLVLTILVEIWRDRKSVMAWRCCTLASLALAAGAIGLLFGERIADEGKLVSTALILIITVLLAQGYAHQIRLIVKSGETGAVDLKMSQFILMMDISTIAFAVSMGLATGWPLLVLAIVSAFTKLVIMYLFRWVRVSTTAERKRRMHLVG